MRRFIGNIAATCVITGVLGVGLVLTVKAAPVVASPCTTPCGISTGSGVELLSADVEPDDDQDGLGDESQDADLGVGGDGVPADTSQNPGGAIAWVASSNNAVQLYKDFASALPGQDESPPEGQEFFTALSEKYGEENPDPYATYGDDAVLLAADPIERSGSGEKADILSSIFATRDRQSVLGSYSIDEDGDTTLTSYPVPPVDSVEDPNLNLVQTYNYQDVNHRTSKDTRPMLDSAPGEVWLAETGGLVRLAGQPLIGEGNPLEFPASLPHALTIGHHNRHPAVRTYSAWNEGNHGSQPITAALTALANWIPLADPAGGPSFYPLDEDARDFANTTGDGMEDVAYRFASAPVVPDNVGPKTTPNFALVEAGLASLGHQSTDGDEAVEPYTPELA
jgi:hypothetical protein